MVFCEEVCFELVEEDELGGIVEEVDRVDEVDDPAAVDDVAVREAVELDVVIVAVADPEEETEEIVEAVEEAELEVVEEEGLEVVEEAELEVVEEAELVVLETGGEAPQALTTFVSRVTADPAYRPP